MRPEKLRAIMALNKMKDKDLAILLDLEPSAISRRMSGSTEFSAAEINKISAALRLSEKDIVDIFLK